MARVFKQTYTKKTPGGGRVTKKTRKWYIDYTDATGKPCRVPGYTDKRATEQKAAELERDADRQRAGIVDIALEHVEAPLVDHIKDWIDDLERAKRSPEYVRKVKSRIERQSKELQWGTLASIRPDTLSRWLGQQVRSGMGERTANHYLEAGVAFCNWCVAQRRLERNPLELVKKAEVVEPRCVRRAGTPEELQRLLKVAGRRALVYLTAILTGLRRKELRLLQWGDVVLDEDAPRIELRAKTTKSRRADTIPIVPELVEALKEVRPSNWKPTDKVFRSIPKSSTFLSDLRRAGIERYVDGKKLDLHALRTTFGTLLATSKVDIREAMQLMRHTDIRLTTKVYTDLRLIDTHGAASKLPRIMGDQPDENEHRATGTDGLPLGEKSLSSGLSLSLSEWGSATGIPQSSQDVEASKSHNPARPVTSDERSSWDGPRRRESSPDAIQTIPDILEAGGIE